jgi:hypothetical protein
LPIMRGLPDFPGLSEAGISLCGVSNKFHSYLTPVIL